VAFGQRVREVRSEVGMTQEALAEAAGLHPTFISNIERGYRVPTVPTMLRVAKGLRVPAGRLVEGLEEAAEG
jgi:transcriptional regulator with XRE-family HTH domain